MERVPNEFKPIFWDVDIDSLDLEKHRRYIIERILSFGDVEHLRWMFQVYSQETILEEVKTNRNIHKKSAVLIANLFGIPKEELMCLRTASAKE